MAKRKIEDIVEEMCKPIAERCGVELIDVEYKKEGSDFVLRAIIDKPGGVTIEDCECLSRELSDKLDETDPIENEYNLEVQSPGERSLKKEKEFEYFKGRDVEIKFFQAIEGRKSIEGKLHGLEDGFVKIAMEDGEVLEFPRDKVANVKLKIYI